MKKIYAFIVRKIRLAQGKCPYCATKMVKGYGGSSALSVNAMTACPNRHYAEEVHPAGAVLIYDEGGSRIDGGGDLA